MVDMAFFQNLILQINKKILGSSRTSFTLKAKSNEQKKQLTNEPYMSNSAKF